MRTFIAIDLPGKIKAKLKEIEVSLRKCDLNVKWVEPKNLHLTLKFLGETEAEKMEKIKKIIREVTFQFTSFAVNFKNFGFFPNEKRPRVFFVATDKEKTLGEIAQYLEEKLEEIGFRKEGRFKSHITLARIKEPKNIERLKEEIKSIVFEETFFVKEIILSRSILAKSGPIYEQIFSSPLTAIPQL